MDDREETMRLIMRTAKVVEYLEPFMSKELLCKFPDNSAFDFDYSQSSLWSPLAPRPYSPMELDLSLLTPRKLSFNQFGFGLEVGSNRKVRSKSNIKKKIAVTAVNVNLNLFKSKKRKRNASDFSPTPIKGGCAPILTEGWGKVLKAASKHFKKRRKDSAAHMKLPNPTI